MLALIDRILHPSLCSYFLRVLAIVDSLNLLSFLFLHVNDVSIRLSDYRLDLVAALGSVPCKLYDFALQSSLLASSWLIVLVSCERCLVLYFPLRGRLFCSGRHAALATSVTLALICASQLFRIVFSDRLDVQKGDIERHEAHRCTLDMNNTLEMINYAFGEFFVLYFPPNVLILVLNLAVIRKIDSVAVSVRAVPNARSAAGALECSLRKKRSHATIILVCIALIYLLTNLPATAEHTLFYLSYYLSPNPSLLPLEATTTPAGVASENSISNSTVSFNNNNNNSFNHNNNASQLSPLMIGSGLTAPNETTLCYQVNHMWSVRVTMFLSSWQWLLVDPWMVVSYATSFYTYVLFGQKFRRQVSVILKETTSRIISKLSVSRLRSRRSAGGPFDEVMLVENQNLNVPRHHYHFYHRNNGGAVGQTKRNRTNTRVNDRNPFRVLFWNRALQRSDSNGNSNTHPNPNWWAAAARVDPRDDSSGRRAMAQHDYRSSKRAANGGGGGRCREAADERLAVAAVGVNAGQYLCPQHAPHYNLHWDALQWCYNPVVNTNRSSRHKTTSL